MAKELFLLIKPTIKTRKRTFWNHTNWNKKNKKITWKIIKLIV